MSPGKATAFTYWQGVGSMTLNSGLTLPGLGQPSFISSLSHPRVRKGSRAQVWCCSHSPGQPPQKKTGLNLWLSCECLSQPNTHCPRSPKYQFLQVCDYGHLQEAQGSISYTENKPLLGIENFHITFLCKSDGKFGLGKFSHLKICKFTAWL